jgi:hypothetical protein
MNAKLKSLGLNLAGFMIFSVPFVLPWYFIKTREAKQIPVYLVVGDEVKFGFSFSYYTWDECFILLTAILIAGSISLGEMRIYYVLEHCLRQRREARSQVD